MPTHPAIKADNVAVITGGADGIGRACAIRFVEAGMKIVVADLNEEALATTGTDLKKIAKADGDIRTMKVDVGDMAQIEGLRDAAFDAFGKVHVLMNNAGRGGGGGPFQNYENWQKVLNTNLWGVINGVQAFSQRIIDQGEPAAIINTGSKQGITCPPGDTAYNVTKAGIKVVTEGLQHELRNIEGGKVTAHLLVPGFTYTSIIKRHIPEKPAGAWTPEQVADFLLERMARGDFYIICPDNDVTEEMDRKRILWAAGDLAENRPPLSRWHPDFKDAFEAFSKA
jgi:NAD(P)-dependent dehydrogenase (short-subunit alcohol dehydrogenase family)